MLIAMPVASHSQRGLSMLPAPKKAEWHGQFLSISRDVQLELEVDDRRIADQAHRWQASLSTIAADACRVTIAIGPQSSRPGGYEISIMPGRAELVGYDPQGCFHGLQTLAVLSAESSQLPLGRIVDWPDFEVRGVLHDVSRGKVPTLSTLKTMVDLLVQVKINQLHLYIEHAFEFTFDPKICDDSHGLTAGEIAELDQYCRDRFVELVPAVANLGHMGKMLCLPRYRYLAEIPPKVGWRDLTWPERARGFTLDCLNPESRVLVRNIWRDIHRAFAGRISNICGDEPWDLGQGVNAKRLAGMKIGEAYVDHIRFVHDLCRDAGREVYAWADVISNYPSLLDRLPDGMALLHWGYDDDADYEQTARFVEAGHRTIVCPGVSGWKRILNDIASAETNIHRFAQAGQACGAMGIVTTDWGDHGHFNALASSWHGLILGASKGWNADQGIGDEFDEALGESALVDCAADEWKAIRSVSMLARDWETWRWLWEPSATTAREDAWSGDDAPLADRLSQLCETARQTAEGLCDANQQQENGTLDRVELAHACRFTGLFAGRLMLLKKLAGAPSLETWCESWDLAASGYAKTWLCRNKAGGLADIRNALRATREDLVNSIRA
ncbi:MAG: family 20 glycosylhydrolase [Planctomycetota bacterium]|jgi:hypothetical protein